MSYNTIRYEVADNVAVLTLSRPDRLNAFTREMMTEMIDAFDKIDADDNVRAVIVTGEGRGFCAGADLGSGDGTAFTGGGPGSSDYSDESNRDGGGRLTLRIFKCLKPV